jgi:hypothetical protein
MIRLFGPATAATIDMVLTPLNARLVSRPESTDAGDGAKLLLLCSSTRPAYLHPWSPQGSRLVVPSLRFLAPRRACALTVSRFSESRLVPSIRLAIPFMLYGHSTSKRQPILSGTASIYARLSRILHRCPG